MRTARIVALLAAGALIATAAAARDHEGHGSEVARTGDRVTVRIGEPAPKRRAIAVATLQAKGGSGVAGTVRFRRVGAGVQVKVDVTGLTPGDHGFHVHEFGDCAAQDGASAGPHFNPTRAPHGGPHAEAHHGGDLGNIVADAKGRARLTLVSNDLSLGDGGPHDVVGRSVIVHAVADDLKTQPTGNSGARIACGMIALEGGDTKPVTKAEAPAADKPAPDAKSKPG